MNYKCRNTEFSVTATVLMGLVHVYLSKLELCANIIKYTCTIIYVVEVDKTGQNSVKNEYTFKVYTNCSIYC